MVLLIPTLYFAAMYLGGSLPGNLLADEGEVDELLSFHLHPLPGPAVQAPVLVEPLLEGLLEGSHLDRQTWKTTDNACRQQTTQLSVLTRTLRG